MGDAHSDILISAHNDSRRRPNSSHKNKSKEPISNKPSNRKHLGSRRVLSTSVFDIESVEKRGLFPNSEKSLQERALKLEALRMKRLQDEQSWVRRWTHILQHHLVKSASAPFACTHQLKEYGFTPVEGQSDETLLIEPHNYDSDPRHLICTLESRALRGVDKKMQARYRALEQERDRHGLPTIAYTPKIFGRRNLNRRQIWHKQKGERKARLVFTHQNDRDTERPKSVGEVSPWTEFHTDNERLAEQKEDSGNAKLKKKKKKKKKIKKSGTPSISTKILDDNDDDDDDDQRIPKSVVYKSMRDSSNSSGSTRMTMRTKKKTTNRIKIHKSMEVNALPTVPRLTHQHRLEAQSFSDEPGNTVQVCNDNETVNFEGGKEIASDVPLGDVAQINSGLTVIPVALDQTSVNHGMSTDVSSDAGSIESLQSSIQHSEYSHGENGNISSIVVARARELSSRECQVPDDAHAWSSLAKKMSDALAPRLTGPFFFGRDKSVQGEIHPHAMNGQIKSSEEARIRTTPRLKTPISGTADRQRQRAVTPGLRHRQLWSVVKSSKSSITGNRSSRKPHQVHPCTQDPAHHMLERFRAEKLKSVNSVFQVFGSQVHSAGLIRSKRRKGRLVGGFGVKPHVEVGDPSIRLVQGF